MNLLGPGLVRDLVSIIQGAEADDAVQVLVFKRADPDYFISHVGVTRINEYREEAAKLTGEASIALLFRHLSASRLVTIAQIEGRVRGAGSEFVLKLSLRLHPDSAHDRHPLRPPDRVLEQRRLADTGIAPHHKRSARSSPGAVEHNLEPCALALTADQHLSPLTRLVTADKRRAGDHP
jgi:hypothetical protein